MNFFELAVFIVSLIILFFIFRSGLGSNKKATFLTLISMMPIYLSLESVTQFLTIDEYFTLPEIIFLKKLPLTQWDFYALRTTDLFIGVPFVILQSFIKPSLSLLVILAKSMHWFFGFLLVMVIYNLLLKNFIQEKNKVYFSMLFMYFIFLLPTNMIAFKVFTYDLFSMLLSILTVVYIFISLKNNSLKNAILAVLISVFASQEKLISSPFFLMASVNLCYLFSANKDKKDKWISLFKASLASLGLGLFILAATFFVVWFSKEDGFPDFSFSSVCFPIFAWVWPLIRLFIVLFGGVNELAILNPLFFFVAYFVVIFVSMILFFKSASLIQKFILKIKMINLFLWLPLLLLGISSTFIINAYWAPFHPIKSGLYIPPFSMNGVTWHFDAASKLQHILSYIGLAVSVFVNAIPTVFWIVLALFVVTVVKNKNSGKKYFAGWDVMFFFVMLCPVIFGITETPVVNRYFNIPVLLFALFCLIVLDFVFGELERRKKGIAVSLILIVLFLEVLPFGPLFAPFRPIWSSYPRTYSNNPEPGRINGPWQGWGEEVMLAGKKIEKICKANKIDCGKINLYYSYKGEWVGSKALNIQPIDKNSTYSERDYYVINRSSVTQNGVDFPYDVKPVFTIAFRGFTQAWIFRGDDLQKAGINLSIKND